MCDKDTLQTEEFYKMLFIKIDCGKEAALFESRENSMCKCIKDFRDTPKYLFITIVLQKRFLIFSTLFEKIFVYSEKYFSL